MLSVILVVSTLAVLKRQDGSASGSRDNGREAHALLARMKTSRDLFKKRGTSQAAIDEPSISGRKATAGGSPTLLGLHRQGVVPV